MKHCIDCKHFSPKDGQDAKYGLCKHTASKKDQAHSDSFTNWLVAGSGDAPPDDVQFHFAGTMRGEFGECGPDGKLFEPKPAVEAKEGE